MGNGISRGPVAIPRRKIGSMRFPMIRSTRTRIGNSIINGSSPPVPWIASATSSRPTPGKAFWGTAVEGRAAQTVGAELSMTPGAVYVAKSRILARLRVEVRKLQDELEVQ